MLSKYALHQDAGETAPGRKSGVLATMSTKPSRTSASYRPFAHLKALLEEKSFPISPSHEERPAADALADKAPSPDGEAQLFQKAMAGVEPMAQGPATSDQVLVPRTKLSEQDPDAEALGRLTDLVSGGDDFTVSDTPEYMEGVGYGIHPHVARRLHQGDFSIQAHLDLHGLGVEEAQERFELFLKEAVLSGKKAVLVIHGRGLSSAQEPVLKAKVKEWLTAGPWRKWVVAFTSARACDGGAGGTYVLLRRRPATKRYRRQHRQNPSN
jgi:DNA-nicking Smr family endonuclease